MTRLDLPRRLGPGAGAIGGCIAIVIASSSCSRHDAGSVDISIDTAASLTIQLGFAFDPIQYGTWEDPRTGERTFYFANTNTGRMLKRFDDQGRLVQTVPLSAVVDSMGISGWSIAMQSPDSIFLFSEITTEGQFFALVDGQGAIRRKGGLRQALVDPQHFTYDMKAGAGNNRIGDGFLFEVICTGTVADTLFHGPDYAALRHIYDLIGRKAHLAVFHLDTAGRPSFTFGQYGFYVRSCAEGDTTPRRWMDGLGFTCLGDRAYHFSMHTPWVQRLDERTATVDSFLVRSDMGPCHAEIPPMTGTEMEHAQDSTMARFGTNNYITSVSPCPPLNVLLVQVMKGAPIEVSGSPDWRPEWSWVVHDTDGVRLGEKRFAGDTYDGWCVLWNGDRAWVKRASTPKEQREGTLHFDRLGPER